MALTEDVARYYAETPRPDDVPPTCPMCGSERVFWTMTHTLCLNFGCRWSERRP